eukprot:3265075-Rhodomonas_salina.2
MAPTSPKLHISPRPRAQHSRMQAAGSTWVHGWQWGVGAIRMHWHPRHCSIPARFVSPAHHTPHTTHHTPGVEAECVADLAARDTAGLSPQQTAAAATARAPHTSAATRVSRHTRQPPRHRRQHRQRQG